MSARATSAELGVVVALPGEAAGFGKLRVRVGECTTFDWGVLAVAGMGCESARNAASALIERGAQALLSWGIAGGLSSELVPGDLLLPRRIVSEDGEWLADRALRARVQESLGGGAREGGDLYCSDAPVAAAEAKRSLAARGMSAVDMESAGVAMIARRARAPFVAVKAICDPASREIPEIALRLLDRDGGIRWRALPDALRQGPRAWHELNVLRGDMVAARGRLWRAARALPRCAQP